MWVSTEHRSGCECGVWVSTEHRSGCECGRSLPSELMPHRDGTYRLWGEVKIGEGVQLDKELLHQLLNLSVPLVLLVLLHCLHMQR